MDITVVPLGTRAGSLSRFIAGLEEFLDRSGLLHRLHDMGTTVEGTADELFAVARELHEQSFAKGAPRVYTIMKIDDRRDREVSIGDKVASVETARRAAPNS